MAALTTTAPSTMTMDGGGAPSGVSSGGSNVERRCENADCNVVKLVSMVPKRKTTQFVSEPLVMEKPMLINGFTTVFQVDGTSAKLSDIKAPPSSGANAEVAAPKTIFRIVPNTHAHIVNYVVVDADGDSLRKINESDPATMRKLLESQKVSADQMLKKLMAGHSANSVPLTATIPSTVNTTPTRQTPPSSMPSNLLPLTRLTNTGSSTATVATTATVASPSAYAKATRPASTSSSVKGNNGAIQLPARMHPNLKITAVAGAENVGNLATVNTATSGPPTPISSNTVTSMTPLITPVPLANLQGSSALTSAATGAQAVVMGAPAPVVDTVFDKPVFDKMQAELQELRRTVAMLAEAQAKNLQQQSPQPQQSSQRGVKRSRPI